MILQSPEHLAWKLLQESKQQAYEAKRAEWVSLHGIPQKSGRGGTYNQGTEHVR